MEDFKKLDTADIMTMILAHTDNPERMFLKKEAFACRSITRRLRLEIASRNIAAVTLLPIVNKSFSCGG